MKRDIGSFTILCYALIILIGPSASAQTPIKPSMLIIFDTSGSMTWIAENLGPCDSNCTTGICSGSNCVDPTFGDGSIDLPGYDRDGNGLADDSRMYILKEALSNALWGTSEIQFGLMRYHQVQGLNARLSPEWYGGFWSCSNYDDRSRCMEPWRPAPAQNAAAYLNYDGNAESCAGGDVLVNIAEENTADIIMWIDQEEDFGAGDFELRGDGGTPIGGSLDDARDYFRNNHIPSDAWSGCRGYYVLLLTDGEETCSGDPEASALALRSVTVGSNTYDVKTFVIGLGGNTVGSTTLNDIAVAGGTEEAFFATDAVSLQVALNHIIQLAIPFETCNGLDDDCNGLPDDGLFQPCSTACGTGAETCQNGVWGDCSAPPVEAETCDGYDNDCDGLTDENLTQDCSTACGVGTETCSNGRWLGCNAPQPHPEVCDNQDNDCDTLIDEDVTQPCSTECGTGIIPCENGSWGECTAPQPQPEVCDNVDNDCDGATDENLTQTCSSACGVGMETCIQGAWVDCTAPQPSPEVCDGMDNDCDGHFDENLTQSCSSACGNGTETCVGGVWQNCTAPQPQPEQCDSLDNDCDGSFDENLSRSCSTACGAGTETCVNGNWGGCTAPLPQLESCDGQDNDCDGQVDNDLTRECSSACGIGLEACVSGAWVNCTAPQPSVEVCDGADNDCDGHIDEDITQPCSTVCGDGIVTCNNGAWGECSAPQPSPETCDGQDNDCDGIIDDGVTRPCSNLCGTGIETCNNGVWVNCTAPSGSLEICDGQDNDCDGDIDEDLVQDCTTLCGSGQEVCVLGVWQACTAGLPMPEQCNGLDDDCDGHIDEDLSRACATSCGAGTETCENSAWVGCTAPQPQPESCDGQDNDCDGQIDNNLTRECSTACGAGLEACVAGAWVNCTAPQPRDEVCDGQDNDCDGLTDEDITMPCSSACGAGVLTCINGAWANCDAPQPQPETCNNADDDCDGVIDDGLTQPCSNECGTGIETCTNGVWANCTAPGGSLEVCDGQDNDCDGDIDENLVQDCSTACGPGQEVCVSGLWQACTAPQPQPETCNDNDDDCDGVVDGLTRPCSTSCGAGVETCLAGTWGSCDARDPSPEVCDNIDNDCDGQTDNGLTQECATACGVGLEACVAGVWVNCTAPEPEDEVCDGADNDCDDEIDEEITLPCESVCGEGVRLCVEGLWGDCDAPLPEPEICDGIDNDCDGVIDDGLTRACANACGTGIESCVGGVYMNCTAPAGSLEVCDGVDNDCDTLIDEDLVQDCSTACGPGQQICQGGAWLACNAPQPQPETCDGLDNDCDGLPDDGLVQPCSTLCGSGEQRCVAGVWQDCSARQPEPETCDGVDNDCDGQVDNDLTRSCGNGCGQGLEVCVSGAWVNCSAPEPALEVCDGSDNDCDGAIDEELTIPCSSPCEEGVRPCSNGAWGECSARQPQAEACDGQDNDCDGVIDDGLTRSCENACGAGVESCVAGDWVGCTAPAGSAEVCDGIDNDCDGETDEELARACSTACGDGQERCLGGAWQGCDAPMAQPELCDGEDNDCDGEIDEELTQTCSTACGAGQETCIDAQWQGCDAPMPLPELCDNLDNDCDGQVDNLAPQTCATACGAGLEVCVAGAWVNCNAPQPSPEVCDGVDNDCDGDTDEELVRPCESPCGEGTETCQNGTWGDCLAPPPSEEICDGVDNDCDGETDEELTRECAAPCGAGVETCLQGEWGECVAPPPMAEICDGYDNDCDGAIDEDVTRDCSTVCGQGVQVCEDASWGPCSAPQPGAEICDGEDNDCDGNIDENLERPCSSACGQGTQTCQAGEWALCTAPEPLEETCDNLDNDCDGLVDEDVFETCSTPCGEGVRNCLAGVWSPCMAPDISDEICDCIDNDCDGETDEDVVCEGLGQQCVMCECATPCAMGECPVGFNCIENFCITDLCYRVFCAEGRLCIDGECIDPICADVECDEGLVCDKGDCIEPDCYILGCPGGEICREGDCTPDPCFNAICPQGDFCRGGLCVPSCAAVECGPGKSCIDGTCVTDLCAAMECEAGEVCEAGACVTDACMDLSCPTGRVCISGSCEDDPCLAVLCPSGEICDQGQCVADSHPIQEDGGMGERDGGVSDGDLAPSSLDGEGETSDGPQKAAGCQCTLGTTSSHPGPGAWLLGGVIMLGWLYGRRAGRRRGRPLLAALLTLTVAIVLAGCGNENTIPAKADSGPPPDPCSSGWVTPEVCDGEDNDCDGEIDEDYDVLTDPMNCGACGVTCSLPNAQSGCFAGECIISRCAQGWRDDNGDATDGCEAKCVANAQGEFCDGVDNDCDGVIDNGIDMRIDPNNCGWCDHKCVFDHAEARCILGVCTLGSCEAGFVNLDGDPNNGCETSCEISNGGMEICDGEDNNCDGHVDEGFDLDSDPTNCGGCDHLCALPNALMECDEGQCRMTGCEAGFMDRDGEGANGCEVACDSPTPEACDGVDNDCDGVVDEDFELSTDIMNCGACNVVCAYANAEALCQNGDCALGPCEPGYVDKDQLADNGCEGICEPTNDGVEACDGEDNDCDGLIDEDFDLAVDIAHCGVCDHGCDIPNAVEACRFGVCIIESCEEGFIDADRLSSNGCEEECTITNGGEEACDGEDNDCDGFIDEDFHLNWDVNHCGACNNPCEPDHANPICIDGQCAVMSCQEGYTDANGEADDGCELVCTITNDGLETCDELDNDCDGQIDEGFDLSTNVNHCGECNHSCMVPNTEVDCQEGECVVIRCQEGFWDLNGEPHDGCEVLCTITNDGIEACDRLDNDCNGVIDDGFDLTSDENNCGACDRVCDLPHAVAYCENSGCAILQCEPGYSDMDRNASTGCESSCTPTGPEMCDEMDNDCDGLTDEGFDLFNDAVNCGECGHVCELDNAVAGCGAGTCMVDRCLPGFTDADRRPSNGCEYPCEITNGGVEACDEEDNDCDGHVDEDFNLAWDADHCGGCNQACDLPNADVICINGGCEILRCQEGHADINDDPSDGCEEDCTITNEGLEVCDEVDNDCDGLVDEGFDLMADMSHCGACNSPCRVPNGEAECLLGQCTFIQCKEGFMDLNQDLADGCEHLCTVSNGGIEVCDYMDNDCNGLTDEGFDLLSDVDNCLACGRACLLPHALAGCEEGACVILECEPGFRDIDRNAYNGCENACTPTGPEVCDEVDNDCNGLVDEGFDLYNDEINCGVCGHVCELDHAVAACSAGYCVVDHCVEGFIDADLWAGNGCEYVCEVTNNGIEDCDGLDNDCDGFVDEEHHLEWDVNNCGACGEVCAPDNASAICINGSCQILRCREGFADINHDPIDGCEEACLITNGGLEICDDIDNDCDGSVDEGFDLMTNTNHCGLCNHPCSLPNTVMACDEGECVAMGCQEGFVDLNGDPLDGCEHLCTITNGGVELCDYRDNDCNGLTDEGFDTADDVDNCGACGRQCRFPNAVPLCDEGICRLQHCLPGFVDFDGNLTTGCEMECTPTGLEACDGLDNNCNGLIDEGFDLFNDSGNCGACGNVCQLENAVAACGAGSCVVDHCVEGFIDADLWPDNGCEYTCQITNGGVEACDQEDNDCDGFVDEDFYLEWNTDHCGACNQACLPDNGTPICINGSCEILRCNAGFSDANHNPLDGCELTCTVSNGGLETCDEADNDCDGVTDEGFDLQTNVNHCGRCNNSCVVPNTNVECQEGACVVLQCAPGFVDRDLNPENGCEFLCTPSNGGLEICDYIDNDCNGVEDDGFDVINDVTNCGACGRVCELPNAVPYCNQGVCAIDLCLPGYVDMDRNTLTGCEMACEPTGLEICDGLDNDCNGLTDEVFDLFNDVDNCGVCGNVCDLPNAVEACGAGRCVVDHCDPGFIDADLWPDNGCEYVCAMTNGGIEACDGLDNDCDGFTDEDFHLDWDASNCGGCGVACDDTHATPICVDGDCQILRCEPGYANANGDAGDGCELVCTVTNGGLETCDEVDNDCDGVVDEGFNLETNVNHCGRCDISCTVPNTETACEGGLCVVLRCQEGFVDLNLDPVDGCEMLCSETNGGVEICDYLDNDCNGVVDDGFDVLDDIGNCGACGRVCSTPHATPACLLGSCIIDSCDEGYIDLDRNPSTGCELECTPSGPEVCDERDNDCDGLVDEDFDLQNDESNCGVCGHECTNTGHAITYCNSGECDVMGCEPGFRDVNGQAGDGCECPLQNGGVEICNNIDDDCSGVADDHLGGPPLGFTCLILGVCEGVMPACQGGEWVCPYPGEYEEGEEATCDTLDNDCDGLSDEVFPDLGGVCGLGLGVCRGEGEWVCDDNGQAAICTAVEHPELNTEEVCDGLDNDCDGVVDEDSDDMVPVAGPSGDFWIYRHEASRPDATADSSGTSFDRSCSREGVLPWTNVDHGTAATACADAGHRLCTEEEWMYACQSGVGNLYPYGNTYSPNACNGWDHTADQILPTGDMALCITSGDPLYDLSGNVWEWVEDEIQAGVYAFRGGAYENLSGGLTCTYRNVAEGTVKRHNVGFRCCE